MRPPDLKDRAEAWLIPVRRDRKDWRPDWDGTLALYLLHCGWSHPFWHWYHICGIHLRPIPGVRPPKKFFPEASHEIMILALDPKVQHDPDLLASGEQELSYLSPPDLIHQVGDLTDDQFKQLVQDVVLAIVEGKASPDQDWREWWRRAIDETAEHIREGKHRVQ